MSLTEFRAGAQTSVGYLERSAAMGLLRSFGFITLLTLSSFGCPLAIAELHSMSAPEPLAVDTNIVVSISDRSTAIRVISKASGKDILPGIDVAADGRCWIRQWNGSEFNKQITPAQVSALLSYLEGSGFFGLSNTVIDTKKNAVDHARGSRAGVTDANYTSIFASKGSKTNRIERYALEFELERYPTIFELKTIRNAYRKIQEVVGEKIWW